MCADKIKTVAIVGGTHGNELTGQYLIEHWRKHKKEVSRNTFESTLFFANVDAAKSCRRYVEQDLNRQFSLIDLDNPTLIGVEQQRAKEINNELGPKGDPKTDLIIDLHTTTSHMGPTLLLPATGEFYVTLAAYILQQMPEVTVFWDEEDTPNDEHHLLCTIARYGVIVEVGPVPQGSLRQDVYDQSKRLTGLILDFVEVLNSDSIGPLPSSFESFRFIKSIMLPLNENGDRVGMVHHERQDKDFQPIYPGDPLFTLFDGRTIDYCEEAVNYGVFINEAAYYDNNLAMSLAEKVVTEL